MVNQHGHHAIVIRIPWDWLDTLYTRKEKRSVTHAWHTNDYSILYPGPSLPLSSGTGNLVLTKKIAASGNEIDKNCHP